MEGGEGESVQAGGGRGGEVKVSNRSYTHNTHTHTPHTHTHTHNAHAHIHTQLQRVLADSQVGFEMFIDTHRESTQISSTVWRSNAQCASPKRKSQELSSLNKVVAQARHHNPVLHTRYSNVGVRATLCCLSSLNRVSPRRVKIWF